MQTIDITSLPKISFAHTYKADSYFNVFPPTDNFIEVAYISDGELTLNDNGVAVHKVKKGDVICLVHDDKILLFNRSPHCHQTVAATVGWTPLYDDIKGLILPLITPASADTSAVRDIIIDIIHKQDMYKTVSAAGAARFLDLLCAIDKCNRNADTFDIPSTSVYIQRIKEYVQLNIHEAITQKSVAQHLGISCGYLCSIFKKSEGITLMKYINRIKLENLKALMDIEGLRLCQAAPIFGYSDPNYVSRLFKQIFGYNITEQSYSYPGRIRLPEDRE